MSARTASKPKQVRAVRVGLKLDQLAPNGTNLGLSKMSFSTFKKVSDCPIWVQSAQNWV